MKKNYALEALFQQQMWLWGQDIRAPQGNLLKAYGFDYRSGKDAELKSKVRGHHSSCYCYDCAKQNTHFEMRLWSFGLALMAQDIRVFTERHRLRWQVLTTELPRDFSQLKALPSTASLREAFNPGQQERFQHVLRQWCLLLARYEAWVLQTQGLAWRAHALASRPGSISRRALALGSVEKQWLDVVAQI